MSTTSSPLTQPDNPTSTGTGQKPGFWNILKNRVLPMVGNTANKLAMLYGSPEVAQGAERSMQSDVQQQELARQHQFDVPALAQANANVADIPIHHQILQTAAEEAQRRLNTTPNSFEEALSQDAARKKAEAGYTPIPAVINGQLGMGTMTGPGEISPITTKIPPPVQNDIPPQFRPPTDGPAGVPGPIANTVAPIPKLTPGPWDRDASGQMYQTMYDQMGREVSPRKGMPAGAINASMPSKTLIPYLPPGKNPQTATQEDWANAANVYNTRESSHTGIQMVTQPDGSVVPVPVNSGTTTTRGAAPSSTEGKKPQLTPRGGGGRASVGTAGSPVGGKVPPQVAKAYEDYNGALTRQDVMNKSLPAALAGNQQAQINIVANHLGMTAGIQKGARINQTLWTEAMTSAPWLDTVLAKFSHVDQATGDHVFDGPLSGVTIPPEALKQMVSLATDRVTAQKAQWEREIQAAKGGYGMGGGSNGSVAPPVSSGVPAATTPKWNPKTARFE